jgi:hypothetical protein
MQVVRIIASLILVVLCGRASLGAPSAPLVFVPGILGSKLCVAGTQEVVWGDSGSLKRFSQLRLPPQGIEDPPRFESCGAIKQVQILGPLKLHQYDRLFETLAQLGYEENNNLFIFHYDWRISNETNAERLAGFIKDRLRNARHDILAHSMGGLISRIYMQMPRAQVNVRRFVAMGVPHLGSASVFRTAEQGWGFWKNLAAGGLTEIRSTMLSFPAIYELLPSYKGCCFLRSPGRSEMQEFVAMEPNIWSRFKWLPDYYRTPAAQEALRRHLAQARRVHEIVARPLPVDTELIPIIAGVFDTPRRVFVDPKSGSFTEWLDGYGDGTVWEWSASNGVAPAAVHAHASTAEHQLIFDADDAVTALRWALVTDAAPTAATYNAGDFRLVLRTPDGRNFDIARLALTLEPAAAGAGQSVNATLRILGASNLAHGTFEPQLRLIGGPDVGMQTMQRTRAEQKTENMVELQFKANFFAPEAAGAYAVQVRIEGESKNLLLDDVLAVMK